MARKKKETMELRFYEVPQGESVLALLGESWDRVYGHDVVNSHFHNLMEIGVCRRGAGDMVMDTERWRYETGMVTIIPENYPHTTISAGEDTNFWEYLFFDPKEIIAEMYPGNFIYINEIVSAINKRPIMFHLEEFPSLYGIIDTIMEEARQEKQYSREIIKYYVRILVIEMMRQNAQIPYYRQDRNGNENQIAVLPALEYINKNFAAHMKAKDIADACNMSETHFRRMFEAYINMPPMDYVNLVRVQKACEMMNRTTDSMEQIAIKCGFATISTFNRNFKKYLEVSPYQWKINSDHYQRKLLKYHISPLRGW